MKCVIVTSLTLVLLPLIARSDETELRKLPEQAKTILAKATTFEVYSLEPEEPKKPSDKSPRLRGYKVLGKTTLKRSEKAGRELLAAFDKAIGKGEGARCFVPRHAIHAEHAGKAVDLLICFECQWVEVYFAGQKNMAGMVTIDAFLQPRFDKILRDAKIPLAKRKE